MDEALLLRPQRSLFQDEEPALDLDEYQQFTTQTDRNATVGFEGLGFVLLGLFGEVGSLLSELKKKQRDKDAYVAYHESVIEELGDTLWYFANAALRAGLRFSVIAQRVPAATLDDWGYRGRPGALTFRDLQLPKERLPGPITGDLVEHRLLALAGKVGGLLEDWSSGRIRANRDVLSADLVEIFRALLAAADDARVSLDDAARRNVEKTIGRWPVKLDWGPLFDEDFPAEEQIPRHFTMTFRERQIGDRRYVVQQMNGVNIGDRLTDNRRNADDYRFHDVFHLAYAGVLGWSPCLRAMLKLKRKSRPEIDENEDGARAGIIEEGISTWIFNHGVRNAEFRNAKSLDYSLLKAVRELVKGYEVEVRPLWQWERAILEGFRIFRLLRKDRGGAITVDLNTRSISFEPIK